MSIEGHYQEVRDRLKNGYGTDIPDIPIDLKHRPVVSFQSQIDNLSMRLRVLEAAVAGKGVPPILLNQCEIIIRFIMKTENVTKTELMSRRRGAVIVRMRHIGFYLCAKLTGKSLPQIGAVWQRDHTTVFHGNNKIIRLRARRADIDKLLSWYEEQLAPLLVNSGDNPPELSHSL